MKLSSNSSLRPRRGLEQKADSEQYMVSNLVQYNQIPPIKCKNIVHVSYLIAQNCCSEDPSPTPLKPSTVSRQSRVVLAHYPLMLGRFRENES